MDKLEPSDTSFRGASGSLGSVLRRVSESLGGPGTVEALAQELSPRDLRSLLLYVVGRRAMARKATDVLMDHEELAAVRWPAPSARELHALSGDAFDAAAEFEAVDLPPMTPLGATFALSGIHPNNVVTAVRGLELLGDPTIPMALEAARRRKRSADRAESITRLCAVHRVMRMQPTTVPGYVPHFRIFAAASAGRDRDDGGFAREELRRHLRAQLDLLERMEARGHAFADVAVQISDTEVVSGLLRLHGVDVEEVRREVRAHRLGGSAEFLQERGVRLPVGRGARLADAVANLPRLFSARVARLDEEILTPLAAAFPRVSFACDLGRLEGLGYYSGPCLRIEAADPSGARYPLADGGALPWTARLLTDQKERFVVSGMGLELVSARFRPRDVKGG
ncbi:MAG TPA: hypothetical protein VGI39_28965 [Polyangiaceae bacterium]|jgi:hypothetical protein